MSLVSTTSATSNATNDSTTSEPENSEKQNTASKKTVEMGDKQKDNKRIDDSATVSTEGNGPANVNLDNKVLNSEGDKNERKEDMDKSSGRTDSEVDPVPSNIEREMEKDICSPAGSAKTQGVRLSSSSSCSGRSGQISSSASTCSSSCDRSISLLQSDCDSAEPGQFNVFLVNVPSFLFKH